MAVDYADRMAYLVSEAGGLRAAARQTGIPRTTLTRILKGQGKPSKRTRERLNRKYRATAPAAVRKREKAGLGSGSALVDERTARVLERSYIRRGIGRGSSVDEAKKNLNSNFDRIEAKYPVWTITPSTKILYRVYPIKEAQA